MKSWKKLAVDIIAPFALGFLKEKKFQQKMDDRVSKKVQRISRLTLGKELNITGSSKIKEIPFTGYELYKKYYESPMDSHFLFNMNEYVASITSGTMGKPKKFLLPKAALLDNLKKTALASLLITSHDGERVTLEIGDSVYANTPGGAQIAALFTEIGMKNNVAFVKQCVDHNLPFQEKMDFFVKNYKTIDIAYMTVTTLLDEVYPRIGEPFKLKGFMTQDVSAGVFKDEIKKITGCYPRTTFGSTETLSSTVGSIEHPGGFIFDWRVIYSEFIPEKEQLSNSEPIITADVDVVNLEGVEPKKRYQLIATPYLTELTRYIMPDILECVAIGDSVLSSDLPVFKYHARSDRLIVLHNFTRIAEEELLKVLKDARIPFVDFTVRKEHDGTREYIKMYLELSQPIEKDAVYGRIDSQLTEFDRDWRELKEFLKYMPLKLELLPKGSFNNYLGKKEGMARIERIQMKKEHLKTLLGNKS